MRKFNVFHRIHPTPDDLTDEQFEKRLEEMGIKSLGLSSNYAYFKRHHGQYLLDESSPETMDRYLFENDDKGHYGLADDNKLMCLDIEHWPDSTKKVKDEINKTLKFHFESTKFDYLEKLLKNKDVSEYVASNSEIVSEVRDVYLEKYKKALEYFQWKAPHLRIGYYAVMPTCDYWLCMKLLAELQENKVHELKFFNGDTLEQQLDIIKNYNCEKQLLGWIDDNEYNFSKLGKYVDVLFPSIYSFYPNHSFDKWRFYAKFHLQFINQLTNNSKTVYPFIWPRYHTKQLFVPEGYFFDQLEFLRDQTDVAGCVVWSSQDKFSTNTTWFKELTSFCNQTVLG